MGEDKSGLYITTIVGVVAVLALVLLYLNGSGGLSANASPTGAAIRGFGAAAGYSGYDAGSSIEISPDPYRLPYCARAIGVLTDNSRQVPGVQEQGSDAWNKLVHTKACSGSSCFVVDPETGEETSAPYGCVNGKARYVARTDQAFLYN